MNAPEQRGAVPRTDPLPSYAELRARNLMAQSLISHRLDDTQPDVQLVLAALRGEAVL